MLDLPTDPRSSNLYLDLALEFHENKHDIYIIAPSSHDQNTVLKKEKGVQVLRVRTLKQIGVSSKIKKGIAQVLLPYQYKNAYKKYLSEIDFDLILMPTPPITLIDLALYVKKKTKAKLYLILRDIYPQAAVDTGLINSKLVYTFFRYLEKKTYNNSDIIGCMSQGNIDYVINNNPLLSIEKLVLLPNWQKAFSLENMNNDIRLKFNLQDKYIVLFGGNIGYGQKVENIILLAKHYQYNKNIVFLVIGNGVKKKYLQQMTVDNKLDNIMFMDGLPRDEYLQFVAKADIGLITIDDRFTVPTIPSKTTSYFCLKLPVLAIIDAYTDYGKILEESKGGLWSVGGDDKSLFNNFDKLFANPKLREEMGLNGYKYFEEHLASNLAYSNIIKQFNKIQ